MKTCLQNLFLLPTLIVGLGFIPAEPVAAQTFTYLHFFSPAVNGTNSDGSSLVDGLVLSCKCHPDYERERGI
jgi:hypothetical protein